MALKFFRIPVEGSALVEAELNAFLSGHKVLRLTRELVERESSPGWAVCVEYVAGAGVAAATGSGGGSAGSKRGGDKIDYREVLSTEEFAVYAQLRDLRKELAQKEGVPVYGIFRNDQLAAIAQQRPQSHAALGKIDGIGEARVEKFGAAVLALFEPNGQQVTESAVSGA